jgi:hypothetical protein
MRSLADATGHTALIAGGGSWCNAYQAMPDYLPQIEKRFKRVILLPSSFDVSVDRVKAALRGTQAMIFAREQESFRQIRELCSADLAHDCAFFFDYSPYRRQGRGVLNAFRTDREGLPLALPLDNNDLSVTCSSLDEWLWTIARCEMVQTDRAHVTIAAHCWARKSATDRRTTTKSRPSLSSLLQGFPVEPISQAEMETARLGEACLSPATHAGDLAWVQAVRRAAQEMVRIVPRGCSFILVDDDRLGSLPISDRRAIPFLERGGQYWGAPRDDDAAINELRRLREASPHAMVFAWPAFWWLDHYKRLSEYLTRRFPCVLKNELLVVFDLTHPSGEDA